MKLTPEQKAFYEYGKAVETLETRIERIRNNARIRFKMEYHELPLQFRGDFRAMPFSDGAFRLVVFDPPHLIHAGESSWLAKKYGKLDRETWQEDLKAGFRECFRVLEPGGVLVFKWCEDQVSTAEVLKLAIHEPLFGHRRGKTVFLVFMKSTTPN